VTRKFAQDRRRTAVVRSCSIPCARIDWTAHASHRTRR